MNKNTIRRLELSPQRNKHKQKPRRSGQSDGALLEQAEDDSRRKPDTETVILPMFFAGRLFQLEDLSEVDPDEVPGSSVASP